MFRFLFKVIVYVIEKIISELALLSAVLSVVHGGTYFDRILGGMLSVWRTIYGIVAAYVQNKGLYEVIGALKDGTMKAIDNIGVNIKDNPQKVLLAFVATFIFYKLIAFLLNMFRKVLLNSSSSKENINPGRGGPKHTGEEYKKLYGETENPEPPRMAKRMTKDEDVGGF